MAARDEAADPGYLQAVCSVLKYLLESGIFYKAL